MKKAVRNNNDVTNLKDALELDEAPALAAGADAGSVQGAARAMLGNWTGNHEKRYEYQAYELWVALEYMDRKAIRQEIEDAGYDF